MDDPQVLTERRDTRLDRWLLALAGLLALALGIVLWSQAGRDVFLAMMSGLWALCF